MTLQLSSFCILHRLNPNREESVNFLISVPSDIKSILLSICIVPERKTISVFMSLKSTWRSRSWLAMACKLG